MKVLFSDFDGTLVKDGKEICIKNKEKMKELQQAGHLVVICTGRNLFEFQKDNAVFQFPYDYLVLNNGAMIVDNQNKILYEKSISKETGIDILNHLIQIQDMWSYFCDNQFNYAYKNGMTYDYLKDYQKTDKDFIELYHRSPYFQILCFHQENQKIEESQKCFDYIMNHYSNEVEAYFNLHFVDVVAKGCSKGMGMHLLLQILNNHDEVYAIGDSYNDLSMLKEANYGYTFIDAHEDIKKEVLLHVGYVYEVIDDMLGGK